MNDLLTIRTGEELSRALASKEWGRPMALGAVIVSTMDSIRTSFDLLTFWTARCCSKERDDSSERLPGLQNQYLQQKLEHIAVASHILGTTTNRSAWRAGKSGQTGCGKLRGRSKHRGNSGSAALPVVLRSINTNRYRLRLITSSNI